MHFLSKLREGLFTKPVQNLRLVAEVQVDRPRRVFDLFGDLAYGNVFIPFPDKQGPSRIQNLFADAFLLPSSPFLNAHSLNSVQYTAGRKGCQTSLLTS